MRAVVPVFVGTKIAEHGTVSKACSTTDAIASAAGTARVLRRDFATLVGERLERERVVGLGPKAHDDMPFSRQGDLGYRDLARAKERGNKGGTINVRLEEGFENRRHGRSIAGKGDLGIKKPARNGPVQFAID